MHTPDFNVTFVLACPWLSFPIVVNEIEHDVLYCNTNIWWSRDMGSK